MPTCNFCQKPLEHVFLDLGFQPPSNSFLTREQLDEPEVTYPLRSYVCNRCWLVQVPESKKAVEIFKEDYPYYSSQSPANVAHAKEYAEMMCERFDFLNKKRKGCSPGSRVLEIGSNDGYLLQWFREKGNIDVRGYEPSIGPAMAAQRERMIYTDTRFFNSKTCRGHGKFDLICSINTIAHQPDINDFVEGIRIALKPGGVTTHEFPWLIKTLEGLQFDQFYHEHLSYFSLATIYGIFHKHGLVIFDVDELPEHGGSLRIYAQHSGGINQETSRVGNILAREDEFAIDNFYCHASFQDKVQEVRSDFMRFLYDKPKICAYGAPAKANTFLNYCKVTPDLLPFTVDISPHKQGKFLPGSHIPVLTEEDLINYRPDYVVILTWNLKEEIMEQLSYIRNWNGKFVVAIPELEVI